MKSTPSSTARRSTANAPLRSFGGPQMPSPIRRIAPKPRRCTEISPPSKTSPAKLAESSFLSMTVLQNSYLDFGPTLTACIFLSTYNRCVSSQATAGWRTCRQTGGLFYKARIAPLPRPLPFLPVAWLLGKSSSVENFEQLVELAQESGASRSP